MAIGSIVLLLGILNFLLILFQIASGKRWIKVSFAWHTRGAVALVISAFVHALLAILIL